MKRALVVLTLLVTALDAAARPPQLTIKVGVDLVNVPFIVTDNKGRLVPGLTAANFTVEEDGQKQEIQRFSAENELPLTIALLLDTSPSVADVLDEEKRTASEFFKTVLRPSDLALAITFDSSVTLVQDFTEDPAELSDSFRKAKIGRGTSLYDAIYLAAHDKLRHEAGRKAIILISDGQDTTSHYDLGHALIAAHESDAIIYAVSNVIETPPAFLTLPNYRFGNGGAATLKKLSDETGGAAFFIRETSDFQEIFTQIVRDLRSEYSLAFKSSNTARDGKFRRLKIVPKDSNLRVRARRGYYAPRETPEQ